MDLEDQLVSKEIELAENYEGHWTTNSLRNAYHHGNVFTENSRGAREGGSIQEAEEEEEGDCGYSLDDIEGELGRGSQGKVVVSPDRVTDDTGTLYCDAVSGKGSSEGNLISFEGSSKVTKRGRGSKNSTLDSDSSDLYQDAMSGPSGKGSSEVNLISFEGFSEETAQVGGSKNSTLDSNSSVLYQDAMSGPPNVKDSVEGQGQPFYSGKNSVDTSPSKDSQSDNSNLNNSGTYPWMGPPFQLDPQPLPGLAQTSVYEFVQPTQPNGNDARVFDYEDQVGEDFRGQTPPHPIEILQQQNLPGMNSGIYELATHPDIHSRRNQSDHVFHKSSSERNQTKSILKETVKYDPPWSEDYSLAKALPRIQEIPYDQRSPDVNAHLDSATGASYMEDDNLGENIYDTALEISTSYDELRKQRSKRDNQGQSNHLYGIGSGKDIEFSASFDVKGKYKKNEGKATKKSKVKFQVPAKRCSKGRQGGDGFPIASGSYDEVAGDDESIYEDVDAGLDGKCDTLVSTVSNESWGSDFSDVENKTPDEEDYPDRPLPPTPKRGHFKTYGDVEQRDEDCPVQPVKINLEKHPPPELPDTPKNLTGDQDRKRRVIGCIIDSERSYISSLERIIQEYKTTLLFTYNLGKTCVKTIITKAEEILDFHRMFQIELAEAVSKWDVKETIGGIFTASFSRSMVVDVYSTYVNNFAMAMEEIKSSQNTNLGMKEFLNTTAQKSPDRLTVFALMVKPVQRFPQFIMLMQDLLKYTPHNHHDRSALQRALTDLENVAHKLNERKRESEQIFNAKQLQKSLNYKVPTEKVQRLIRQEHLEQMEAVSGQVRTKGRHVILMDDSLICCTILQREVNIRQKEQYKFKWMIPLLDMELKESAITPDMQTAVKNNHNVFSIHSTVLENKEEDLYHLNSDLQDYMHDIAVLNQISGLMSTLKNMYEGLTVELVDETIGDLQKKIQVKDQQLQLVNSCSIILQDITKKTRYIFQTQTPEQKQEWCIDFLMARLTQDPQNNPSWDMSSMGAIESDVIHQPAMYMKSMSVDMPRHYTQVKCAVPVFLTPSGSHDISIQHLWVVTTSEVRAQVSLVSIQTTKPVLIESFQAANTEIIAVETVPGFATIEQNNAFLEDTVWMSTCDSRILVYSLFDEDGIRRKTTGARKPRSNFYCHGVAVVIRYADDRVFVGLDNGNLVIYDRNEDGAWMIDSPNIVQMTSDVSVSCILAIEDEIWVACGDTFYIVPVDECLYQTQLKCDGGAPIAEMVRSGCGLWVSFKDQSYVRLYHIETKENLQEINVKSAIDSVIKESVYKLSEKSVQSCVVTSLMASRGLLWVGTSIGFICTLPLPWLRDGVPLVNRRPIVSYHAHNGPVKFLFPIYCGTVNLWHEGNPLNSSQSNLWRDNTSFRYKAKPNDFNQGTNGTEEDSVFVSETHEKNSPNGHSQNDRLKPADGETEKKKDALLSAEQTESGSESGNIRRSWSLDDLEKSMEKEPVQLRDDHNKLVNAKNKRKTLTLRTELAQKIQARQKAITTLKGTEENEVDRYFGDLMNSQGRKSDESIAKTSTLEGEVTPNKEEEITKKNKPQQNKKTKRFSFSKDKDANMSPERVGTLKSFRKSLPSFQFKGRSRNTGVGESISKSTSVRSTLNDRNVTYETMRKRNCNAVIMISGGDGYIDWRKEKNLDLEKNSEASLMTWMYKY